LTRQELLKDPVKQPKLEDQLLPSGGNSETANSFGVVTHPYK